jgi:WD40 repeat protein/nucleoside phosphorylase
MAEIMKSPEVAHFTSEPAPEGGAVTRAGEHPVDVLILTALQDELEAVLALGEDGPARWQERKDQQGFRCYRREVDNGRGGRLRIAAAWTGEMGGRTAAVRAQQLIGEFDPACLAMCGICAGYRKKVALGDVIVADQLYSYDEGKVVAAEGKPAEVFHSLRTFDLQAAWKMDAAFLARELDLAELSRGRPRSRAAQRRWLLSALLAQDEAGGAAPASHPDRKSRCPDWTDVVRETQKAGLVALQGGRLSLAPAGREQALNDQVLHVDGLPEDPPFQVHVGAITAGVAVQEDPGLFERLRRLVRTTLGVEMEGAAIGDVAARFARRAIVVKAVSDHADQDKDDSFRGFACRASAEVLMAFLLKHVEPAPAPDEPWASGDEDGRDSGDAPRFEHHGTRERDGGFIGRVERVALLRDPAAKVTRHRAPAPFAGVLEVAVRDGELVDLRIIAAIEQSITEALVEQYQAEVERRFRQQDPLLRSMLVHGGSPAPAELGRAAARRGVVLKSFGEYQRLFDFGPYLAKQTGRLDVDTVYPPWLYVEQPARWSLAGGRDEQATERALETLWGLLEAPHPRFALVLGDFGAGKTFLLHELARRMDRDKHPLVPVLVEMSKLDKQHTLKALLAQHFAYADVGRIDLDAFHYLLAEGRIALLFDGFDELALRLTYDRALEHFETVMAAAQGNAKVVVTSRTQHFLTDQQVRRALAERAEQVPGYRLLQLEKFGEPQIRRFLGNIIAKPEEAEERYRLLDEVKDLLGLSTNPRMLGFIAKIAPEKLREAKEKSGEITAAKLYEILIAQWLDFEYARVNPPGAPRGISRVTLQELVTRLAGVFWERNAKALAIGEFREMLVAEGVEPAVVEHMIGSGSLLVRDAEGRFSFVHRSVMEWLVAEAAAVEVKEKGDAASLGADEMSELMADFFISLAGREQAEVWAIGARHGDTDGHAKKNCLSIMNRLVTNEDEVIGDDEFEVMANINLAGQDLRGRNLSGTDLRKANLTQANLWSATLVHTKLGGAFLMSAQLGRADLSGADLSGADLRGSDMSFARLVGADLRGANLKMARLRGAKLVGAQGVAFERLTAVGAAPPVPSEAEPTLMSLPSGCNTVAWSSFGDIMASGHDDGSLRLWDVVSGHAIRTILGHMGAVRSVTFSPDGLTLASGSDDNTVRLWDVTLGRALHTFHGHMQCVSSVAFSSDGLRLASGSSDMTVRLWDVSTRAFVCAFEGHEGAVLCVAFNPNGLTLASGAYDKSVRLWDVTAGQTSCTFWGHNMGVRSVAFSPDGLTLGSGSDDKTIRIWDVTNRRALGIFAEHQDGVRSIAFSPDGLTLGSGSDDKLVRIWDIATRDTLLTFEGHTKGVWSVAFNCYGSTLASGSPDRTVRLWNVVTGRNVRTFGAYDHEVPAVALSPGGLAVSSGSSDGTVRLWNIPSGRVLRTLVGHTSGVSSVAFSPNALMVASGSYDERVRLWEVATGRVLRTFVGHTNGVRSIAFSPDGLTVASGSSDTTVRLWELASGRVLRTFVGHTNGVGSIAFSPDGLTVASGSSDTTVRLWEIASGRILRDFGGHDQGVNSVAFAPDGHSLASGSSDTIIRIWNVATGQIRRTFGRHRKGVTTVAFSPDGLTVASGSSDCTVRLWEVTTGLALGVFAGHTNGLLSVAFSPDGLTLASGSSDGTIRLWEVATARCLAILLPCREGWAAFTPDGRYKLGGDIAGSFWHVIGLCRFEPGELDPYLPLRVPDDEPLFAAPSPRLPR